MNTLLVKSPASNETNASVLFNQRKDMEKSAYKEDGNKIMVRTALAYVFAPLPFISTAPELDIQYDIPQDTLFNSVSTTSEKPVSIAEEISNYLNHLEQRVFAYSGAIVEIEKNASGDAKNVLIKVSINGKSHFIKKSVNSLGFDVQQDMPLIIEGIKRGSIKKMNIKKAKPISLSEEQIELLKTL